MAVQAAEGEEVGKVAAVMIDKNRWISHFLLGKPADSSGYWLVAICAIVSVEGEIVSLSIPGDSIVDLPPWQSTLLFAS